MKSKSERHGKTKSFDAAGSIDELVREYGVKTSIKMSGNVEAQPRMQEPVNEAGITRNRADSGGFTLDKTMALLAFSLAFVAAVFGVSVNAINSSVNGRLDDMNARFDRLEDSITDRFNDIDEKFNDIDARFDDVDARFNEIDARFYAIDARFDDVDARFNEIDARFNEMGARFDDLDAKVDANTEAIARLGGVPVVTLGSSDSQ